MTRFSIFLSKTALSKEKLQAYANARMKQLNEQAQRPGFQTSRAQQKMLQGVRGAVGKLREKGHAGQVFDRPSGDAPSRSLSFASLRAAMRPAKIKSQKYDFNSPTQATPIRPSTPAKRPQLFQRSTSSSPAFEQAFHSWQQSQGTPTRAEIPKARKVA